MYVIEKNIPAPNANRTRGRKPTYPFGAMEIGDSFAASCSSLSAAMRAAERRTGFHFVQAREGSGVRVWRVAPVEVVDVPASEPVTATEPVSLPRVRKPAVAAPAPAAPCKRGRKLTADPSRGSPAP